MAAVDYRGNYTGNDKKAESYAAWVVDMLRGRRVKRIPFKSTPGQGPEIEWKDGKLMLHRIGAKPRVIMRP